MNVLDGGHVMTLAYDLPESWARLGIAIAAVLAGVLALRLLSRALVRAPSAAGWLLARAGLAVVTFGLLMWLQVIPHEPVFPTETLGVAVGALVGGGMGFLLVGRALTSQASRSQQSVRLAAPAVPVKSAADALMTLPPGGPSARRATGIPIGSGSR